MASKRSPILPSLLLACCALVASERAVAQPTAAERETARNSMAEGDRLRASGDLRAALTAYRAADAIMHVPTTGLSVAQTQADLDLLVEALATAMDVVNLPAVVNEPKVLADARAAASALADALQARVPTLRISVSPEAATVRIRVDDTSLPTLSHSASYRTNPGSHGLCVEAAGFITERRQVALAEGEEQRLLIELRADPAASAPAATPTRIAPAFVAQQDRAATENDDPWAAQRVRGIVAVSVGGAAIVGGGIAGITSLVETAHEKKACRDGSCQASHADALARANRWANVANVALPVGAVAIGYGLFELLRIPRATEDRARVRVDVAPGGAVVRGEL